MPVLLGMKTIECRTWQTDYRGDLLICSSSKTLPGTIAGHALCIVNLDKIEPFQRKHIAPAYLDEMPEPSFAWHFSNLRWVKPFAVKGTLHLYDVDDALITDLPDDMSDRDCLKQFYEPLLTWKSRDVSEDETRAFWQSILDGC